MSHACQGTQVAPGSTLLATQVWFKLPTPFPATVVGKHLCVHQLSPSKDVKLVIVSA